jgi:16S rRNA (guanine966-N2)-methyltransferase
VRITGGRLASRRLVGPPRALPLRPTPDALREQAFAVLGASLDGAVFLDLFAGTGVNACEALSRGARRVLLVERDRRAVALIRRNLEGLGIPPEKYEVLEEDALPAVRRLASGGGCFTHGWCDPPFAAWDAGVEALELAASLGVLSGNAQMVLEVPPHREARLSCCEVARVLRGAVLLRLRSHETRGAAHFVTGIPGSP